MLITAVSNACGMSKSTLRSELKKEGDLGSVAADNKKSNRALSVYFKPKTATAKKEMTVRKVYDTFMTIAMRSGGDSVTDKTNSIQKLMMDSKPLEVKYIIRWLEGNLSIGAAEKTIVSALARAFTYTPGDLKNFPPSILNYKSLKGEIKFKETMKELENAISEAV